MYTLTKFKEMVAEACNADSVKSRHDETIDVSCNKNLVIQENCYSLDIDPWTTRNAEVNMK